MIYIHYMKINLFRLFFPLVLAAFAAPLAAEQTVTLVKQEGNLVYLDTTPLKRNVTKGDSFKLITSKQKLSNPKTGADLGFIYKYSPEGTITEVQPRYAVGTLSEPGDYKTGSEAVIEAAAAPVADVIVPLPGIAEINIQAPKAQKSSKQIIVYEVAGQTLIGVAQADVMGNAGEQLVTLSNTGQVSVFAKEFDGLTPLLTFSIGGSKTPLAISAKDLKKTGKAQIFVSFFDEKKDDVYTQVWEVRHYRRAEKLATLNYFVKEQGCGTDKELYAQKAFVNGRTPGNGRELEYEDGRFKTDDDSFKTHGRWLSGVAEYDLESDGSDNFIYTEPDGSLVASLKNGSKSRTQDLFAGAPNRVKYKQNTVTFYPSVYAYGPDGAATVAALENVAKKGLLSNQFAQYQSGKLHFLTLQKGKWSAVDTVELDGYAYDIACTNASILVPEVNADGSSRIVEILK